MNSEILNDLKKRPSLSIRAKKILYGCDLTVTAQFGDNQLTFNADGTARFGPKKSAVTFKSFYDHEGELKLKSCSFSLPGIGRSEEYLITPEGMEASINGEKSRIDLTDDTAMIDFLLLLHMFARNETIQEGNLIPVGKKLRRVTLTSEKGSGSLSLGNKINLQYSQGKISVPKFKVSVDCNFI